jgi:hypothetical protein
MWNMYGRCIGHGGFPEFRFTKQKYLGPDCPKTATWQKLRPKAFVPGAIVLDGPNPDIPGYEDKYFSHGYLALEFDDGDMIESIYASDGTLLLENELT